MSRAILNILKDDDNFGIINYADEGGDINLLINGKSLLTQALDYKADTCLNFLLLKFADLEDLKKQPNYLERLYHIDPIYPQMIKEMESNDDSGSLRIQNILRDSSYMILKRSFPSSRNILSFCDEKLNHKKLMIGLFYPEYLDDNFLTSDLRAVFQCENLEAKKDARFGMIVSAPCLHQLEEMPFLSPLITAFLDIHEVPIEEVDGILKHLDDEGITLVGVHYSKDGAMIKWDDGSLDVDGKFYDSMKEMITNHQSPAPILITKTFTFSALSSWDDQLHLWVKEFKLEHGYFPNILLASSGTYSRLDMVMNSRRRDQLRGPEGQGATDGEFISAGGFQGPGYSLDFCIDNRLALDTIRLIYDSDPDGGLPIPKKVQFDEIKNFKKDKLS